MRKKKIERCREDAIEEIYAGDFVSAIHFDGWREESCAGLLDPVWDADGDCITAHSKACFQGDERAVRVTIAQGADPRGVARVLHKVADMLEGPNGYKLANMGLDMDHDLDHAIRFEDGDVEVYNMRQVIKWSREEHGGDQEWRPDEEGPSDGAPE